MLNSTSSANNLDNYSHSETVRGWGMVLPWNFRIKDFVIAYLSTSLQDKIP